MAAIFERPDLERPVGGEDTDNATVAVGDDPARSILGDHVGPRWQRELARRADSGFTLVWIKPNGPALDARGTAGEQVTGGLEEEAPAPPERQERQLRPASDVPEHGASVSAHGQDPAVAPDRRPLVSQRL